MNAQISKFPKFLLLLSMVGPLVLGAAGDSEEEVDPAVFELNAFVVYGGEIDTIDGMTGGPYHENHVVVQEFREDFNKILLAYHKHLLLQEMKYVRETLASARSFVDGLDELAKSFDIGAVEVNWENFRSREKHILARLIKDPFFKIDALIVWDLEKLKRNRLPNNEYAQQIRFNEKTEKWERRVTTEWEVSYVQYRGNNRFGHFVEILKQQGLNLDTNEGFHFINRGLTARPPISAFKDVKLTYPIFINNGKSIDEQVQYLKETFVRNLIHIYDPFSWAARRNVRFRGGFYREILREVESKRFRITDRDWFDPVFANFLNDVVTIQQMGSDEIYDYEMLRKVRVNRNILGNDLDLLNWKEGENRQVDYNPDSQGGINLNFKNPTGARFILLDAYRRYPDTFLPILREKLESLEEKVSGMELIKAALAETTGVDADLYIEKAMAAQESELQRFRYHVGTVASTE